MHTRNWRYSFVATVAVLVLCTFNVPIVAQTRVAVLNFENNSTWGYWGDRLGEAAADELVTQLFRTGAFSVIERSQLAAVLAEQDLGASGAVDPATAARIGQLLGAQLILTGSITQFSIQSKILCSKTFSIEYPIELILKSNMFSGPRVRRGTPIKRTLWKILNPS